MSDVFEQWKGEVQAARRDNEALQAENLRQRRRSAQTAQQAFDASESLLDIRSSQERTSRILESTRERLERMKIPGCMNNRFCTCDRCEALDELDQV